MMKTRYRPINVNIGRTNDYQTFDIRTHLGDVLKEGAYVVGFDLTSFNPGGHVDEELNMKNMPDVILVKRVYPNYTSNERIWQLKRLDMEQMDNKNQKNQKDQDQFDEFLNEIEFSPDMRQGMNLYRNEKALTKKTAAGGMMGEGEENKDSGNTKTKKKVKVKAAKKKAQAKNEVVATAPNYTEYRTKPDEPKLETEG